MNLQAKRFIIFTNQMKPMTEFYRDTLGLPVAENTVNPAEFIQFDAGGFNIALHKGAPGKPATRNKIAFYAKDVGKTREELLKRGVKMGKLTEGKVWHLCDGKDPEGNVIQISNR